MRIFLIDNDEDHIPELKRLLEDDNYLSALHDKFVCNLGRDFEEPQIITLQPEFIKLDETKIANYVDTASTEHGFVSDDYYVVDNLLTSEEHKDDKIDNPLDSSSGYKFAKRLVEKHNIPSERIRLISKFIMLDTTVEPFGKIIRKPFMVGREEIVLDQGERVTLDDSLPEWLREYEMILDFKNQIYYGALKPIINS